MSLITEVETLVNESGGAVWWGTGQVHDAINQALVEMWGNLKWNVTNTPFVVDTSTDIYAFDNTHIMIPQFFLINNLKMFNTNHDELENWSRRWRNEPPGQPKWFVLWDSSHFRVFPKPDATYTFTLWGIPWPSEIGTEANDLTLDPMCRKAIVFRAVANLLELTQPQLADHYMEESRVYESKYSTELRTQLGANIWHLRPGVGWTIAQFGDIKIGKKYI